MASEQDFSNSIKRRLENMKLNSQSSTTDKEITRMKLALLGGDKTTYQKLAEINGFDANLSRSADQGLESEEDDFAAELAALEDDDESENSLCIADNIEEVKVDFLINSSDNEKQVVISAVDATEVVTVADATVSSTTMSTVQKAAVCTAAASIEPTVAGASTVNYNVFNDALPESQWNQMLNEISIDNMDLTLKSAVYTIFDRSSDPKAPVESQILEGGNTAKDLFYDKRNTTNTESIGASQNLSIREDDVLLNEDELELDYEEAFNLNSATSATENVAYDMGNMNDALPAERTYRRSMFGNDLPSSSSNNLPASIGVIDSLARPHLRIPRGDAHDSDDDIIILETFVPYRQRDTDPEVIQIDDEDDKAQPQEGEFIPVLQPKIYEKKRIKHREALLSHNAVSSVISTIVPNYTPSSKTPSPTGLNYIYINGNFSENSLDKDHPSTSYVYTPASPSTTSLNDRSAYIGCTPFRQNRDRSNNNRSRPFHDTLDVNSRNDVSNWQTQNRSQPQRSQSCAPSSSRFDRGRSAARSSNNVRKERFQRSASRPYDAPIYHSLSNNQRRARSRSVFGNNRVNNNSSRHLHDVNGRRTSAYNTPCEEINFYHRSARYSRSRSHHMERSQSRPREHRPSQGNTARKYEHTRWPQKHSTGMSHVQRSMALFRERKRQIETDRYNNNGYDNVRSYNHSEPYEQRHVQLPGTSRARSREPYEYDHENQYVSSYCDRHNYNDRSKAHSQSARTYSRSRREQRDSPSHNRHMSLDATYSTSESEQSPTTSSSAYSSGGSSGRHNSAARLVEAVDVALTAIKRQERSQKKSYRQCSRSYSPKRRRRHNSDEKITLSKAELQFVIEKIIDAKAAKDIMSLIYTAHDF